MGQVRTTIAEQEADEPVCQQQTARRGVMRATRARTRLAKGMMGDSPLKAHAPTQAVFAVSPWTTRSHVGLMSVLAPPWRSHVAKIQRGEAVSCRSHVVLGVNLEKISPAALLTRGDTPRTPRQSTVV